MRTPFASPLVHHNSPDAALYGSHLSVARFGVAIAMVVITIAIALVQKDDGDTAPRERVSAGQLAWDMPLP